MSDTLGSNKRKSQRIEKALQVRFRFLDGPSNAKNYDYINATSRDISEGGVFLEIDKNCKLKDDAIGNFILFKSTLDLEINLLGEGTITAQGKSVWIEKKVKGKEDSYSRGVAVQFTNIAPEFVNRIRNFVNSAVTDQ